MDDLIAKLRAHREHLAQEIFRVDALLAKHQEVAAEISAIVGDTASEATAEPPSARVPPIVAPARSDIPLPPRERFTRGPKGSSPEEISAAAELVILEHGSPMTRFALIEPVEAMGLTIGGHDKPRNLGTILWRSKKFESTGDGYWPTGHDRTLPPDPQQQAPTTQLQWDELEESPA